MTQDVAFYAPLGKRSVGLGLLGNHSSNYPIIASGWSGQSPGVQKPDEQQGHKDWPLKRTLCGNTFNWVCSQGMPVPNWESFQIEWIRSCASGAELAVHCSKITESWADIWWKDHPSCLLKTWGCCQLLSSIFWINMPSLMDVEAWTITYKWMSEIWMEISWSASVHTLSQSRQFHMINCLLPSQNGERKSKTIFHRLRVWDWNYQKQGVLEKIMDMRSRRCAWNYNWLCLKWPSPLRRVFNCQCS